MKTSRKQARLAVNIWMTVLFIVYCIRLRVDPSRFFQLNAEYFNRKKGIYSKLEINRLIPFRWRLKQHIYRKDAVPMEFPVFLKPEWGQNSNGVYRADSLEEYREIQQKVEKGKSAYLLQQAATETREFEIYYVRRVENPDAFATLTVTEVHNPGDGQHPINGVNNDQTCYMDRTREFSDTGLKIIWDHLKRIGSFRMARVCAKADSKSDLLRGRFHIVEINLFTPMPINLMDHAATWPQKLDFIKDTMWFLAKNAKAVSILGKRKQLSFGKAQPRHRVKS